MSSLMPYLDGAYQFFPLNEPPVGTFVPNKDESVPKLFQPLTIRGVTFKNRMFVSPMGMCSSKEGHMTDWHLVHLGGFATRGIGGICTEGLAVLPEGRVTPNDAGIWSDDHIPMLKRIVDFCHGQETLIGAQLGHGGRKSGSLPPWLAKIAGKNVASVEEGEWPYTVYGPCDLRFNEEHNLPKEMTVDDMSRVEDAYVAAIQRCKKIGFDFIEIHAAHGYLLTSFLSPFSNRRTDEYGGQPLENRFRFPLRLLKRCREVWEKPMFVRISATEWGDGSECANDGSWKYWSIEQSILFAGEMKKIGVDLVDCSAGGNNSKQYILPSIEGYQVPYAEAIKKAHPDLYVAAVGKIISPAVAEAIIANGQADVVFLARILLQNPHWPIFAAKELTGRLAAKTTNQYEGWIG
ncbi:FMN-linked oxidoreductase [Mucidula mucida]|nr:FMN-linked oxidoreductase [Mucidula mucida]